MKSNECKISNGKDAYKPSLNFFNKTQNIVAVIDPTYKNRMEASQIKSKDILEKGKCGNEILTSIDNDTDIFLPVQGQKRGTIKPLKKKRTQTQCLQQ